MTGTGWLDRGGRARAIGVGAIGVAGLGSAVVLHLANAAYGGPVFWAGVALEVAATPLLLFARRAPLGVALGLIGVALLLFIPWPGSPDARFTFYNSIDPWVPLVLNSAGACVLPSLDRRRRALVYTGLAVLAVLAATPWDLSPFVVLSGLGHTLVPTLFGMYLGTRRQLEHARHVTAADEPTRRAADELRSAGCQALEELRDVIGMLRQPAGLTGALDCPPPPLAALHFSDLIAESESYCGRVIRTREMRRPSSPSTTAR